MDSWWAETGVVDYLVWEGFTDKCSDDFLLLFDEPLLLRPCQNRHWWNAYFQVVVFVRIVCWGARHEVVLGDVDGDLGWIFFLCSLWYVPYVARYRMISALIPRIGDFSQSSPFSIIIYNLIWSSMSALTLLFVRRRCVQIDLLMMMCLIWSSRFLEFLRRFQYGLYVNNIY